MMKPAYVYRHIDADGKTLYVGCSQDPHARNVEHKAYTEWWPEVARVGVIFGPWPRDVALRLERLLIHFYDPPYNVMGTTRLGESRRERIAS